MLVSDFVHIPRPFPAVRDELIALGPAWLVDSAVTAYREGEQLSTSVLAQIGPVTLSKRVTVELDPPTARGDRLVQRIRWQAAVARGLFPTLDAELDFGPMGAAITLVRLSGIYIPPLGPLGREVNRVLLHRLAEASVRAFLVRVGERLTPSPAPRLRLGEVAAAESG